MQEEVSSKASIVRRVPKQKRSREKYERILDSAAALMTKVGSSNINTQMVVDHADMAIGTIYQFFSDIEEVKIALVKRVTDQLYDNLVETLETWPNKDIETIFEAMVDANLNFYEQRQDVVEIIVASRYSEAFVTLNDELHNRIIEALAQFILLHNEQLDAEEVYRISRVCVTVGYAMSMLIWTREDAKEKEKYVTEWKSLGRLYAQDKLTK